jgi:hypothetical protein
MAPWGSRIQNKATDEVFGGELILRVAASLLDYLDEAALRFFSSTLPIGFALRPFLLYKEGDWICWSDLFVRALTEITFFKFPELS